MKQTDGATRTDENYHKFQENSLGLLDRPVLARSIRVYQHRHTKRHQIAGPVPPYLERCVNQDSGVVKKKKRL